MISDGEKMVKNGIINITAETIATSNGQCCCLNCFYSFKTKSNVLLCKQCKFMQRL